MNITETSNALALAQAFDNRTVGEVNVRAWHTVLGDLDAADVMEAIRRHYDHSTEWLMPAHVRRLVDAIRQERAKSRRRWAAGQAGIPPEHELLQLISGDVSMMPSELREWLERFAEARGVSNQREQLFPRRTYWEREQRAYLRSHDGQPNPLYKPSPPLKCRWCGAEQGHNVGCQFYGE